MGIVSGRYIPRTELGIRSLQLSWSSSQVNILLMTPSSTTGVVTIWNEYVPNPVTAAAAAKSLQSCPTLCDPIDGSPPGSPVPGILQARTLERVAISFSNA